MRIEKEEIILPIDKSKKGTSVNKYINISRIFIDVFIIFVAVYLLLSIFHSMHVIDISRIKVFNTILISILMQAFPFMLIGVLVSSAMHVFIPDKWIVKIFPTKYGLGFLTAMFIGVFFLYVNVRLFLS